MSVDNEVLQQDKIREKYFHDLVIKNEDIQADLLSALNLPSDLSKLQLIHEDRYINGIIADFTLVYDNHIQAIIECKAGDIGVTDYVRGIGQVLQYEYFYENNITKSHPYKKDDFSTILLIPSSVFLNRNFNIALFKYPDTTKIIEINDINHSVRLITNDELNKHIKTHNIVSVSNYYVRDTRIFEIYMLLRYLCSLKYRGIKKVSRTKAEEVLKKTNTINNGNWRNAFISLSSFGLIDSNNLPTEMGIKLSIYDNFSEFLLMMYKIYINPYINLILDCFSQDGSYLKRKQKDIVEYFSERHNNKEILYFTQSQNRYIGSWLLILRDDFGCIDFQNGSSERTLNYNPLELNDDILLEKIRQYTKSNPYIANLQAIL